MQGAGPRWMAGINALSVSPTQQAATPEAMASYGAGCQASISNGRRLAGLNRVDITSYKTACQAKQANLATGAAAGKAKIMAAFQALIPVWAQMRSAAHAVGGPRGTNSVAKFQAALQALMAGVGKSVK
jgi:hypothetical protein